MQPSHQPTGEPSGEPTRIPSGEPSNQPSTEPSRTPITSYPTLPGDTNKPTRFPTIHPTAQPSNVPSSCPTILPSSTPSSSPTRIPYFISTLDIVTTDNEINIRANVTQESILQCAVYQSPDYPLSINNVIFQNHKAISTNLTAQLIIPGLAAGAEYQLYCITRDFFNVISMSYGRLLETAIGVRMKGARKLYVDLASTIISPSEQHLNILTLQWQILPVDELTIVLNTIYGENVTIGNETISGSVNIASVFEPNIFRFDHSRKYTSLQASLPRNLQPGWHTLNFVVVGQNASEYEFVYNFQKFLVSDTFKPSPPVFQEIYFSDDGSYLIVKFDRYTNQGGMKTTFTCSSLFNFVEVNQAICTWTNKFTVHIYLKVSTSTDGLENDIDIGDTIALLPNVLRAECVGSDLAVCSQYSTSHGHNTSVAAPVNPVTPALLISAPTIMSACSGFLLDITGSTGDGGRPWAKVSIVVSSDHSSTRGMLNNYYKDVYQVFPPSPVSRNHFRAGFNYTFNIYVCNFLQKCSPSNTHTVQIIEGEVPNVSIFGLKQRKIYRSNRLTLRANAYATFCGVPVTTKDLVYTWDIIQDGSVANFESVSKQPSYYVLPAFSLSTESVYNITITVYSNSTKLSSSATVDVFVGIGDIKAVVISGTDQSMTIGSSFSIDASESYDEDVYGITGAAAGLQFQWSCAMVKPTLKPSECGVELVNNSSTPSFLTLRATDEGYVGTTSKVSLVICKDTRIDEYTTYIYVSQSNSPKIVVKLDKTNNVNRKQINVKKKLKLLGSIEMSSPDSASWSINDPAIYLNGIALTPVTTYLDVRSHSFNLVLQRNALASSTATSTGSIVPATYVFSLQSGSSISSIEIITSQSPYGGQLISEPIDGIEWFTTFDIAAKAWVSNSLPLKYEIGFLTVEGTYLPLEKKSEKTYTRSYFGHGDATNQYKLRLVLAVYDNFDAKSSFDLDILVKKSSTTLTDIANRIPGVFNALEDETNFDNVQLLVSVFTAPMNAVDCSDVPVSCELLQREDCRAIDNTCGPCRDGYFGDPDSNDPCYLIGTDFPSLQPTRSPTRSPTRNPTVHPSRLPSGQPSCLPSAQPTSSPSAQPTSNPSAQPTSSPSEFPTGAPLTVRRLQQNDFYMNCTMDSHCPFFEACNLVTATCNVTQKECYHNCSNHGNCYFEEVSTGLPVEYCASRDVKCEPVCNCSAEYSGRYCSLNKTVGDLKIASRLELVRNLEKSSVSDNQDEESALSLTSSLFNIGREHFELNLTSCEILLQLIDFSLSVSKEYLVSYEEIVNVMHALNECGYAYSPHRQFGIVFNSRMIFINEYIGRMIDKYSEVVFQDAVIGQDDVELNYPLFKALSAIRTDTQSFSPITVTLGGTLAARYDTQFSSAEIMIDKEFPILQLAFYETARRLTPHNVLSNPLQLSIAFGQMEEVRRSGGEIAGTVLFTLQNDYDVEYGKINQLGNVTLRSYCNDTERRVTEYVCPNGYKMTHTCDGRIGVIKSTCPRSTWQPVCSLIDGSSLYTDASVTQCRRVSFSSTSTVCLCSLPNFNVHSRERTLQITTVGGYLPDESDVVYYFDQDDDFYDNVRVESSIVYGILLVVFCLTVIVTTLVYFQNRFGLFRVITPKGGKTKKCVGVLDDITSVIHPISGMEKVRWVFGVVEQLYPSDYMAFYSPVHSVNRCCQVLLENHFLTSWLFKDKDELDNFEVVVSRCVHLFTSIITVLFIFALYFDLQFPDNKSMCTRQTNERDCVENSKAIFDGQHSLCYWYLSHRAVEEDVFECAYKEVELTVRGVIVLVLVVAATVLPARFVIDFTFNRMIYAPTQASNIELSAYDNGRNLFSFLLDRKKVEPCSSDIEDTNDNDEVLTEDEYDIDVENNKNNDMMIIQGQIDKMDMNMEDLISQIRLQRQYLTGVRLLNFDRNWSWGTDNFAIEEDDSVFSRCFAATRNRIQNQNDGEKIEILLGDDESHCDASPKISPLSSIGNKKYIEIRDDMFDIATHFEYLRDCHLEKSKYYNVDEIEKYMGQVLIQLFMADLMGYKSRTAKVFMAHTESIFDPKRAINPFHKVLFLLLVIGIDSAFLTYIFNHAVSREWSYQSSFLVAYVIQFSVDIWYFEAIICVLMYYFVPFLISDQIQSAILVLKENAQNAFIYCETVNENVLNVPKWFHVSHMLAKMFPQLLESETILAHRTPFYYQSTLISGGRNKSVYLRLSLFGIVRDVLMIIGTWSLEFQRFLFYLFLLTLVGCCYGYSILVSHYSLIWLVLPAILLIYEVCILIWSGWHVKRSVACESIVHEADGAVNSDRQYLYDLERVAHIIDNEMVEETSNMSDEIGSDEDQSNVQDADLRELGVLEEKMNLIFDAALNEMLSKVEERRNRSVNEDNLYQSIGQTISMEETLGGHSQQLYRDSVPLAQDSNAIGSDSINFLLNDRRENSKKMLTSPGTRRISLSSPQHNMVGLAASTLPPPDINAIVGSNSGVLMSQSHSTSPNRQVNFIKPKSHKAQRSPVVTPRSSTKRSALKVIDGDDNSSDESDVELNNIFDTFFNARDDVSYVDGENDDDSMEDYHAMASKFDFRDTDEEVE